MPNRLAPDPGSAAGDLTRYVVVETTTHARAARIAALLDGLPSVECAYVRGPPAEPPADTPRSPQTYRLAGVGVNSEAVEQIDGSDGAGMGLRVVEPAWPFEQVAGVRRLAHADLRQLDVQPISGATGYGGATDLEHGLNVLGIVVAAHNALGRTRGLAPGIARLGLVSEWRTAGDQDVSAAIQHAAEHPGLSAGDVLLISAQLATDSTLTGTALSNVPVEVEPPIFTIIRAATDRGIVVVEAAGNGGRDLGQINVLGESVFAPGRRDSGAIIVGAVKPNPSYAPTLERRASSCFGSRVDCCAWGQDVFTTSRTAAPPAGYRPDFSGTSAAAAIVAGVVLSLQGMERKKSGAPHSPAKVREILTAPANGKTSNSVGVMPDLGKIAAGRYP